MIEGRVAGITGVVFGLAAIPVFHFLAVDLESKADADTFMAGVDDHWTRTALSGGVGLLLAAVLLVHLIALRRVAGTRRALLADSGIAVAALAALGVALSSAAAMM